MGAPEVKPEARFGVTYTYLPVNPGMALAPAQGEKEVMVPVDPQGVPHLRVYSPFSHEGER